MAIALMGTAAALIVMGSWRAAHGQDAAAGVLCLGCAALLVLINQFV
jgi:hypothetical protein